MENRKKILGVNRKTVLVFHRIMLFAMLHSTFIAPCQSLLFGDYGFKKMNNSIIGSGSSALENLDNSNYLHPKSATLSQNNFDNSDIKPVTSVLDYIYIDSDIESGIIGVSNTNPLDDAKDNLFKFTIPNLPNKNFKVYLTYDLYGSQDLNAVSRSINDRSATGGYIVRNQKGWTSQSEEIDVAWLQNGENKIFFNIPKDANYQYQIKNVKLKFDILDTTDNNFSLVVNNSNVNYVKSNQFYIKGFIKNFSSDVKVYAEETLLTTVGGEFEGFITLTDELKARKLLMIKAYDSKGLLGQEILILDNLIEADKIYSLEESFKSEVKYVKAGIVSVVETDGASVKINDSSLIEDKEITLSKIRRIDIAPMTSGLVNVTKGGYAYRFLPDGTKFQTPVTLEIGYDESLIPKGHTANEIKTFYFDTKAKTWIPVERDTINTINKTILSSTNHFTDYINGIIQTPESPETAGFTPTMMNDIKAVDPSAEMTIISPPDVSQKGDANVSYPIKVPAGRKGMQPQIAIQYSSEAGNGWLGEGWNISMPAVSIDSKWGVPTFHATEESEIYTLNGEVLMNPKKPGGKDWMPNRHSDVNLSGGVGYDTSPMLRTYGTIGNSKIFTPRKQGSFAKIERLGTATTNYYWKVTNTDGTINWYGGKDAVVANTVLRDANTNIVHWGLYMTQDVFGNCIRYEYENAVLPPLPMSNINANLNQGKIFHIKNIKYNGTNNTNYRYEVIFNSSTSIRQDASISSRLGVKQIEPYFLDNIIVKKCDSIKPIRKYQLGLDYGKFKKGQLQSVTELDKDGNVFYTHKFEYYDDIKLDGQDVYFSSAVTETICNDEAEPCLDTDNDGVCDDSDPCPTVAGPINNNGCPYCNNCYQIQLPDPLPVIDATTNVFLNGVLLNQCLPLNSFNDLVSCFQAHYPISTAQNNNLGTLLIITNTCETFSTLTITSNSGSWTGSFDKVRCDLLGRQGSTSSSPIKKGHFSDLNKNLDSDHSYSFGGTIPYNNDPNCPSFFNYDFLFPEIIPSFNSSLSFLGSSSTAAENTSLYLGVGIGCNYLTKSSTFGRQWTWSKDKTSAKTALTDINGDGLQDIIIKENGFLYYKPHQVTTTYDEYNEPEIVHSFGSKRPINGINTFYASNGSADSGNFQITFGIKKVGGFLGRDTAKNESETNVYFTDGNGDGLMDIVKNGVVYFNHLDVNQNPTFTVNSDITENMVIKAAPMTIDEPEVDETSEYVIPAYDVVKVWEAPADGVVKIDNLIQLTDLNKEAVVTVEKNTSVAPVCLETNFTVPQSVMNLYHYTQLYTEIQMSPSPYNQNQINQTCASYPQTYNFYNRVYRIIDAGSNAEEVNTSSNDDLLVVNSNSAGYLNLCSTGNIQGLNFVQDEKSWLESITLPVTNTNFIEADVQNNSYTTVDSNNNVRIVSSHSADFFCNTNSVALFAIDLTDNYLDTFFPTQFYNSARNKQWPDATPPVPTVVPVLVNVLVNGVAMSGGPYNILNNFGNFKTNFENQFPGTTVSLNTAIVPNSVVINSSSSSITTITLVNTENNESQTYNFSPCALLKGENIVTETKWSKVNNKLKSESEQLAANKWLIDAKLDTTLLEIGLRENVSVAFNEENNNNVTGYYSYLKNKDGVTWITKDGKIITDHELLKVLDKYLPKDLEQIYYDAKIRNNLFQLQRFEERQLEAKKWLDAYYQGQDEISGGFKSVSPTTCNETPDQLCLLFGALLTGSNSTISNTLQNNCSGQSLYVKKGDRIYFRVHSVDNGNPPVNWNPKVTYANATMAGTLDQNGLKPYESSYSDGFILSKNQSTMFPGNSGTASITWDSFSVTPSDDVVYEIYKRQVISQEGADDFTVTGGGIPIYSQNCPANIATTVAATSALSSITMSTIEGLDEPLTVNEFYFKVSSSSNVKWKQFEWKPKMVCSVQSQVNGENGPEGTLTTSSTLYPIIDYSIYKSFPCSPKYALYNTSSLPVESNLRIKPYLNGVFDNDDHDGILWFVVKKDGNLIGKRQIALTHQSFGGSTYLNVSYVGDDSAINIAGLNGNIEVGFYTDESNLYDGQTSILTKLALATTTVRVYYGGSGQINVPNTVVNLFQRPNPKFGPMLRQWGQFMYSPELVTGATSTPYGNLIKEESLLFDETNATNIQNAIDNLNLISEEISAEAVDIALESFENSYSDLLNYNTAFLIGTPSREKNQDGAVESRWIGLNEENYASELSYRAATMEQSFSSYYDSEPYEFQDVLETGAFGIKKRNKGSSKNVSGGISVEIGVTVGANASKTLNGDNTAKTDYVDFNGDRYPDIITTTKRQYTVKTGGLNVAVNQSAEISKSGSKGWGIGAQASFSKGGDGGGDTSGDGSGFVRFEGFRGNSGGPISGNFSKGESITDSFWTDINGDGLADFLKKDTSGNIIVSLNFGYQQESTNYSWNLGNLFTSKSINISGGTGFSKWNGSAEAGVSLTSAWNNTQNTLVDMNGDGLLDYVNTDEDIVVTLNTGNRFSSTSSQWSSEDMRRESVTVGATSNLGGTVALVWPLLFGICLKLPALSLSRTLGSTTTNKTRKLITDFDGDGYPDLVEQESNNTVKIYHSRIRRTDMLQSVTNPLGGKFTIDYKVQSLDYDNSQSKWAMSDVIIEDNYNKINDGVDVYKKHFVYEKGKYDRREREFYGFKIVKSEDYITDSSGNSVLYRTSVSNYHNESYFLNGLLDESYVIKGGDVNKKYSRTKNYYEIYKLNASNDFIDLSTPELLTYDIGGKEGRRSAAVLLKKTVNELYELNPYPQITTEVNFKYDTKGRVIEYADKGNIATVSDDYISIITYHNTLNALNMINIPQSIKVTTLSGGLLRERKTEVNNSNGTITKILANNDGDWAETDMEYYPDGNLHKIYYPENTDFQRMSYVYTYDTMYGKYVTNILDEFGYSSSATYNSNFDKITQTTDLAGNNMMYKYDSFGRTTKIITQKELDAGKPYTIKFSYYPYYSQLPSGSGVSYDPLDLPNSTFVPVAVTSHYDQQHPTNDIETYTFVDGLARPIQVKKDILLNKTGDPMQPDFVEGFSVSGKAYYDEFGRVTKQYHPWWEIKENSSKFLLNEHPTDYNTSIELDELDRQLSSTDPEGNISTMQYSLAEDVSGTMAIKTKSDVDQNGTQHIISETYKDVKGRVVSTQNEGGNSGAIWTKFAYNEIGELLSYTDTENISTTYTYDMFGRKKMVTHPDNGTTIFNYDDVNMVSLQTSNLQNQGTAINYKYNISRLSEIVYPDLPTGEPNIANVLYEYGSTGNQTGRLTLQQDATGIQEFEYGNMGEMILNSRTVVGPNMPIRKFTTSFTYDSWNRLQSMDYPDGEKITYKYDLGGNLNQMTGEYNGTPYDYIERIDYDYYEQRTYLLYGNKTETYYNYSPTLRRLGNLNVKTSDGNNLFDNAYTYDKIGNVTNLINSAGVTTNDLAGSYRHDYQYDNLNRLVGAQGSFDGSMNQISFGNDANSDYNLEMKYNDTHGIVNKAQIHTKNGNAFMQNTYNNAYSYLPDTHKIDKITDTTTGDQENFTYDLNGNIVTRDTNVTQRVFSWDESNRLRVVTDNSSMQHYIYDAAGERVLKANSDMESLYENGSLLNAPGSVSINGYTSYPSAFMVVTSDGVYSKHYYAGSQRIVSRLGDSDASIFEIGCVGCKEQSSSTKFDAKKLQLSQKTDLQIYADKLKKGTILYKDYKSISLSEQEKIIFEQNKMENSDSAILKDFDVEKAPQAVPIYYYHPDHLGTSTSLTDFNGSAYQFFLNLPFGETMAEQLGSNYYNTPYKFNGKELDEETGFYYYGARYYDPRISIWQSVDPLTEKYKNLSPYIYVGNNPIVAIDPDGRGILNVIGNLFRRAKNGIKNIFCSSCDYHREESIYTSWKNPDPTTLFFMNILGIGNNGNYRSNVFTFTEEIDIQFEQNSYQILDSNKSKLDKWVKVLKDKSVKSIILTGNSNAMLNKNADGTVELDGKSVPIKELKRKRAEAVKEYLINGGVKERKIDVETGEKDVKTTDIKYTRKIKTKD